MLLYCRQSDKLKLAPSVRNYDRVIPPSHMTPSTSSSSSPPPPSHQSKIRPSAGRRGNRLPSSKEVFDLGIHPPHTADAPEVSPSPSGTPEPSPTDVVLDPFPAATFPSSAPSADKPGGGGKRSTKKDSTKSNPARCLRGRPPELQTSYFVPDGGDGAGGGGGRNSAKNDPFWEMPDAQPAASPRRRSIEQSSSFFKPPKKSEDSEPKTEVIADVGTSAV